MAYQHARSNACYSNAVLSGLASHVFDLKIGGTSRKSLIDYQLSLTLSKAASGGATTCAFTLNPGFVPSFGQDVVIALGQDLFWGGTVVDTTDVISGGLVRTQVQAVDWTWRLDSGPQRVTATFTDVAPGTVLATLLTTYADPSDGFALGYVDPALSRVTLSIENATLTEAISQLAAACGAAVFRVRPDKAVDLFTSGFPWPQALTLVNASRGEWGTLTRQKSGGEVRTRVTAVGEAQSIRAAAAAGATVLDVEQWFRFNAAGGTLRLVTVWGPADLAYSSASSAGVVLSSGLALAVAEGDTVAPVVTLNDAPAQATLAASLGRASGVVAHELSVDGGYAECLAAATADLAYYKSPITSIGWVQEGPLARFFDAGAPVTVTLTSPITESGTFTVQKVDLSPGDTLADENPRWRAKIDARVARRPELVDLFVVR